MKQISQAVKDDKKLENQAVSMVIMSYYSVMHFLSFKKGRLSSAERVYSSKIVLSKQIGVQHKEDKDASLSGRRGQHSLHDVIRRTCCTNLGTLTVLLPTQFSILYSKPSIHF